MNTRALLILLSALLVSGCVDDESSDEDTSGADAVVEDVGDTGTTTDTSATDTSATTDAVTDTGGDGTSCSGVLCDGACVDTQSSAAHCGGCGNACLSTEVCSAGTCVEPSCEGGDTRCFGAVVETCQGGSFSPTESCQYGCDTTAGSCLTEITNGTCGDAVPIAIGQTVTSSTETVYNPNSWSNACTQDYGFNTNGTETVFTLEVPTTQALKISADPIGAAEYVGVYLRSDCSDPSTQLGGLCNGNLLNQTADASGIVPAGTYALFVDSFDGYQGGEFELTVEPTLVPQCYGQIPQIIDPSQGPVTVSGDTTGVNNSTNWGQSECPNATFQSTGGEAVFLLVLGEEKTLNITVEDKDPDRSDCQIDKCKMAIFLRTTCDDTTTQVDCTYTASGSGTLNTTLAAGSYYLFIDDFAASIDTPQAFTVTVEEAP